MNSRDIFKHYDTDNSCITLHDCYATNITIEENRISFYFENGFWITPEHKQSKLTDTVRTDSSRVDFYFSKESLDDFLVYVFRKNIFGKTFREIWEIQKLTELVNKKFLNLEFLYQYKRYNEQLFDCWLHFDKSPYHYECQIKIPTTNVIYNWNNLCTDKKW